MAEELSEKRWKRPRTRVELIERLMKYDWGRQLNVLDYMRQFQTWDALWKDLEARETGGMHALEEVRITGKTHPEHIEAGISPPQSKVGEPDQTVYWHGQAPFVVVDFQTDYPWDPKLDQPVVDATVKKIQDSFERVVQAETEHAFRWGNGPDLENMRNVTPVKKLLTEGK